MTCASEKRVVAARRVLEFRSKWPYDNYADEFVRHVVVRLPAGGEMSGLTAHFLFGARPPRFQGTTRGNDSGRKTAREPGPQRHLLVVSGQVAAGKTGFPASVRRGGCLAGC